VVRVKVRMTCLSFTLFCDILLWSGRHSRLSVGFRKTSENFRCKAFNLAPTDLIKLLQYCVYYDVYISLSLSLVAQAD